MKIIKTIKKHPLASWMILMITVKTMLVGGLTIYAISGAVHDDALMIDMADNLLKGRWLGAYDNRRLVKGITFPLYLALIHLTGIPYLTSLSVVYGASCALLTRAVRSLLKHRGALAIFFTAVYWIPAAACVQTTTRVYRNSLSPVLTVLLFACLLNMYFSRAGKGFVFWSVCTGLALAAFWNLREDSIWMLPTVLAACALTAVGVGLENRKRTGKWLRIELCVVCIPLCILYGCNTAIKAVNRQYYGVSIRNELQEGGFTELMRAIYRVRPSEELPQVSIPRSTIEQIYRVSPTFARLRKRLDANFGAGWDAIDGALDGEIGDGWFFWCLRDCIFESGLAATAVEADAVCRQMAEEVEEALQNGALPRRDGLVMPSAVMSPWRSSFAAELPRTTMRAFWFAAGHTGCDLTVTASSGDGVDLFETATRNFAVMDRSERRLKLSGWVVSYDDNVDVRLAVVQQEQLLGILDRSDSEDVYESFLAGGRTLENARSCRFRQEIPCGGEALWLCVLRDGVEVDRFPLDGGLAHGEGDVYAWNLDEITVSPREKSVLEQGAEKRAAFLQWINRLYQRCGKAAAAAGLLCYGLLTAQMLFEGLKKKTWRLFDGWLVCSAFLGSALTLCVGIAYTAISSFAAISPVYLGSGYALLAMFTVLSALVFLTQLKRRFRQGIQK